MDNLVREYLPGFGSSWLVALALGVGAMFLCTLLWKIIRSEEGFIFGYGNWVVGKWQAVRGQQRSAPTTPDWGFQSVAATYRGVGDDAERTVQVKDKVLTLSRLLDGDLAYLLTNSHNGWNGKVQRLVQTLVSGVTRIVQFRGPCRCGFFRLDDDQRYLVLVAGEGYSGLRRRKLLLDGSCAGRAFVTGEDYYCRDIETDPVYSHSERGGREYRSIACVPVRAGSTIYGVICLDAEEPHAFTADDFAHMEVFAAKLAVICAAHVHLMKQRSMNEL